MRELITFTKEMRDNGYSVLERGLVVLLRGLWGSVHVLQIAHPNIIHTLCTFNQCSIWNGPIKSLFCRFSMPFAKVIDALFKHTANQGDLDGYDLRILMGRYPFLEQCLMAVGQRGHTLWTEITRNRTGNNNCSMDDIKISDDHQRRFSEYKTSGASYGGPLLRYRMNYNIDSTRSVLERSTCNKGYVQKSGRYSFFCRYSCQHGVAIGHHISQNRESVLDVAQGIMSIMRTAPDWFLYDNACHFKESVILREPDYWKNTTILGDVLHSAGHVCGEFYNCRDYKYGGGYGIHGINDTVVEQSNAQLATIRLAASFMSLDLLMDMANTMVEVQRRVKYQKYKRFNWKNLFKH